jgi:hypothetical protein
MIFITLLTYCNNLHGVINSIFPEYFNRPLHDSVHNVFIMNYPEATIYKAVYRSGVIRLPQKLIELTNVLFDSGALHSSYISKSFIEKHKYYLQPYIQDANINVRMADNVTTVHIDKVAILDLEFTDSNEIIHIASVSLPIFDMTNNDAIIGLPDIIGKYHILFKDMLDEAVNSISSGTDLQVNNINMTTMVDKSDIPLIKE